MLLIEDVSSVGSQELFIYSFPNETETEALFLSKHIETGMFFLFSSRRWSRPLTYPNRESINGAEFNI